MFKSYYNYIIKISTAISFVIFTSHYLMLFYYGDNEPSKGDTTHYQGNTLYYQGDTMNNQGDNLHYQGDTMHYQGDNLFVEHQIKEGM